MKIALLSSGFPPDLDGIGDNTWWTARQLAADGHDVTAYTSIGKERITPPGAKVVPFFDPANHAGIAGLPAVLREHGRPDWLITQYNPFGYGRRGYCPLLPKMLSELRRNEDIRMALFFHETMVPPWPWKFTIMRLWQAPIFGEMCRLADVGFVSTTRWLPQVRRARKDLPCHHVTIGSNAAFCDVSRSEARAPFGLADDVPVLGIFGQAHVSRLLDWVGEAARRLSAELPGAVILYVGPDGGAMRQACAPLSVIDAGIQPSETIGRSFRAMDLLLSPFIDGLSTRRSSVSSVMQHGIPVATTRRKWTDRLFDEAPDSLLLSRADSAAEFAEEVSDWWKSRRFSSPDPALAAFHREHFSWESIAGNIAKALASA